MTQPQIHYLTSMNTPKKAKKTTDLDIAQHTTQPATLLHSKSIPMNTTPTKIPTSMKIPIPMFALAVLIAGISNAASQVIVIDRDYNSGNNIWEYTAWDESNPFDGIASNGFSGLGNGTSAGAVVSGTQLRRPAFFFEIPTGYASAEINEATLRFRLSSRANPTTDLSLYSAALDTLGTKNIAYAISTFSSASFTDTGLGLATNAATSTNYTFDVTSLVKDALDLSLPTTVLAFRFQMDNDTSLAYGAQSSYTLLGFDATATENRPALTLDVVPEPSTFGLLGAAALGALLLVRRRR